MTGEEILSWEDLINDWLNISTDNIQAATWMQYESIPPSLIWGMIWLPSIISLLISIWWWVCLCLVFKKAGRYRREALIPLWNIWIVFKISWMKKYFWLIRAPMVIRALLIIGIQLLANILDASRLPAFRATITRICWLLALWWLIVWLILPFKLAKRFSQPSIFWLWLLLVYPVFIGILAFDKESIYISEN